MITLSIDVNKLDKSRFFSGKKGRYMDLVLIESPNSKFGDYIVKQGLTKEERDSGQKPDLPILGNAKIIVNRGNRTSKPQSPKGGGQEDW